MTRDQQLTLIYRHTHRDYKGRLNGQRTVLTLRQGGTTLVQLDSLTDAEIADKLPYSLTLEAKRLEAKRAS